MKKLIFLMLLFTGLTGFASPPVIQNPTPLQYCDPNNDGFGAFDLTTKISEVLGALNPNLFTVTFHETQLDAELNSNAIPTPALYLNINPNTQTIYIRVEEIADASSYSVTTLDLIINAAPNIGTPLDLSIEQIPFTGTAVFDLTTNDVALINGMTGVTITYYTTQSNAEAQTAPILPVTSFSGTNGQIIWARVELATTQCASFASFHLYITNPNIVFIPDANFKAKLIALGVDTNADGNIQQSEATGVFSLDVTNSNIADLTGIQYFSNLNSLDCSNNQLTSLNVSNFIFNTFKCTGNALTSLIANNTRAFQFYCDSNNLTTLDLSTAIINQLYCNNNQLSNLIMTNSSISFELHCDNNQLTSIPATSGIQNLWCGNNLFSSLDLSGWTNLIFLNCSNMPSLAGLYIKNGRNESVTFDTNSNLEFICADESQLQVLQAMASGSSILISTYCSFTPGGNYNTVNGIVRYDSNTNGCDSSDIPMSFFGLGISLDTISTESSIYTNNSGNYTLYMSQAGSYTLNPNLENPNYFIISPTVIDATTINNTTTVQDICILPNGIHPDVEVVIAPDTSARPGFDARYQLVYKNKGNQTLSGNVTFTYDDTVLDFVASDVLPN